MTKQDNKPDQEVELTAASVDSPELNQAEKARQQAVSSEQNFATSTEESVEEPAVANETIKQAQADQPYTETFEPVSDEQLIAPKAKSSGKAIALLALLIAISIGGAGYFFGQQKLTDLENRLSHTQQQLQQLASQSAQAASSPLLPIRQGITYLIIFIDHHLIIIKHWHIVH